MARNGVAQLLQCRSDRDFGTLDLHALLSSVVSTVRLDNDVYTIQSLRAAKRCLKTNGLLTMFYSVPAERDDRWFWIEERLKAMTYAVFGEGRVVALSGQSEFLNLIVIANKDKPFTAKEAQPFLVKKPKDDVLIRFSSRSLYC